MDKFLLIDGNALIHRAYHALPPLTDRDGNLVNAVYGFSSAILSAFSILQPDYVAVTFDVGRITFRNQIFDGYKAKRPETDEGLKGQFAIVHEVTKALSIPVFGLEGFEADDLIGTLSRQASKKDALETIILTGDNDAMQLVSNKVRVYTFGRSMSDTRLFGPDEVRNKYGLSPEQIIDYKALAGDSSDNIPGVKGVGEKTATTLLQKYRDLEGVYAHLDEIGPAVRKKLENDKDMAFVSRRLATINQETPITLDLPACRVNQFDGYQARKLFDRLGFKSLIARLPKEASKPGQSALFEYQKDEQLESKQGKGTDGSQAVEIDQKLAPILEQVTKNGVLIDTTRLGTLSDEAGRKLQELQKAIYALAGRSFNINSPSQLAPLLYEELALVPQGGQRIRRGKTHRSTAASELEKLKDAHPIIPLLLEYREYAKLKNTYLDPLPSMVDKDGRLHTTFEQDTSTGRISSKNPNLQNIPIRDQFGARVREAFIAPAHKLLLSADYSQIELRVAAHIADDDAMIKAFLADRDIHDEVSKALGVDRRMAKAINFGILYGMNAYGLASRLEIKPEEAKQYIANYFATYPALKVYMDETVRKASERGYVETMFGRRRYLPELNSANAMVRQGAQRAAINMPLQGTAADIMKLAMIAVYEQIKEARIILQIHDELLLEIDEHASNSLDVEIAKLMSSAVALKVPLKVDLARGKSWAKTK